MAPLLIVEDDRMTALVLQRAVTRLGHPVVARASSAAEALAAVHTYHPEVVLIDGDFRGPQHSFVVGTDIHVCWSTPVMYLSGSDPPPRGPPDAPDARWGSLAKPLDGHPLQDILTRLFPTHP